MSANLEQELQEIKHQLTVLEYNLLNPINEQVACRSDGNCESPAVQLIFSDKRQKYELECCTEKNLSCFI